ncbi:MAG: GNAT family N-acetyltransferase [Clostridia bacterium]|nr:GNAT family N-acetyltransferase [Clostridia bacterium]
MSEILRPSSKGDWHALKEIWHAVFGDSMRYIDAFFDRVCTPSSALVLEADGVVVSAVYILPVGSLCLPGGENYPCTVSYAFATLPAYRSRGYGALIAKAAVEKTISDGYSAATICPAEDSLFNYYAGKVGYHDYFYTSERSYSAAVPAEKGSIQAASAEAYTEMREHLLKGRAHIVFGEKFMAYQEYLCSESGGFFTFETGDGFGCCAAEKAHDGSVMIKELLTSGRSDGDAVSLIGTVLPSEKYTVRSPARGGGGDRRFAMLCAKDLPELPADSPAPWYGFAFD